MQAVLRVHDIVIGRPERALDRSVNPRDLEVSIPSVGSSSKQIRRGPAAVFRCGLDIAAIHVRLRRSSCGQSVGHGIVGHQRIETRVLIHDRRHAVTTSPTRSTDNVWHNRAAAVVAPFENALSAAPRSCHCYPAHDPESQHNTNALFLVSRLRDQCLNLPRHPFQLRIYA
ncbi:hypothetical protein Poly59_30560 [Rubripirellula reticaptiva]|uniref:Uncharacterized protein n=1 Tax=Rubripirellula reticaptiva TaxID=2528013 RepID=A0A5C6ESX3_9BACT|nr:hypothetical protein Poly59_30560 [Rubripirellula reticaptiva]